ncbi:MAG TPA: HPr family phosphocarrier protein [Kineosporiaceae bacterium]
MPERHVVVGSGVGLHARPAALFTQAVAKAPVPVTIAKIGGAPVDASSILLVLTLAVAHADEVVLAAEGEGAQETLDQLAALLEQDLDAAPTGN